MKNHKMRRVPLAQITTPRNGIYNVYVDRYWAVSDAEELYFYGTSRSPYGSPQCNASEMIAQRVAEDGLVAADGHFKEIRRIPTVFVPVNISDYV